MKLHGRLRRVERLFRTLSQLQSFRALSCGQNDQFRLPPIGRFSQEPRSGLSGLALARGLTVAGIGTWLTLSGPDASAEISCEFRLPPLSLPIWCRANCRNGVEPGRLLAAAPPGRTGEGDRGVLSRNRVRNGLFAGGNRIRTTGPVRSSCATGGNDRRAEGSAFPGLSAAGAASHSLEPLGQFRSGGGGAEPFGFEANGDAAVRRRASAFHRRIEHLQGAAAGIDLVVMETAPLPGSAPDFHVTRRGIAG